MKDTFLEFIRNIYNIGGESVEEIACPWYNSLLKRTRSCPLYENAVGAVKALGCVEKG